MTNWLKKIKKMNSENDNSSDAGSEATEFHHTDTMEDLGDTEFVGASDEEQVGMEFEVHGNSIDPTVSTLLIIQILRTY